MGLLRAVRFYVDRRPGEQSPLVTEAVPKFLARYQVAVSGGERSKWTERALRYALEGFAESFETVQVSEIDEELVEGWAGRNGVSSRTFNNRLSIMVTFLNWCREQGWLAREEKHAAEVIEPRKQLRKAPAVWDAATAAGVLELLTDSKLRAYFALACWAGLRPHEIIKIK